MKAICCDRCGKFERILQGEMNNWKYIGGGACVADPCGFLPEKVLCPTCANDFDYFMRTVIREEEVEK